MTLRYWRIYALAAALTLTCTARADRADAADPARGVPAAGRASLFTHGRSTVDPPVHIAKAPRAAGDIAGSAGMAMHDAAQARIIAMGEPPTPSGKAMVRPEGTTIPMDPRNGMQMGKDLKLPRDKGMKVPTDKGMTVPHAKPIRMHNNAKVPARKQRRSMPGMGMSDQHGDKAH